MAGWKVASACWRDTFRRRVSLLLLAVVLLGACSSTTTQRGSAVAGNATSNTSAMPGRSGAGSLDAAAFGQSRVLSGLGDDIVQVTPLNWQPRAPTSYPAPGFTYGIITFEIKEVGSGEWSPTSEAVAGLETPDGALYPNVYAEAALMRPPCPGLGSAPSLLKGASTNVCAIFAVPLGRNVNRLVFTLRSGTDMLGTGESATWRLP